MCNSEQCFLYVAMIWDHQSSINEPKIVMLLDVVHAGCCTGQFCGKLILGISFLDLFKDGIFKIEARTNLSLGCLYKDRHYCVHTGFW